MYCFNGICYDIQHSDNRFTNHSNNPTSFVDKDGNSVAARDINIGEEKIGLNYQMIGINIFIKAK